METDDTENTFGDGFDNRGVDYGDDDAENIQMTSTSSRRWGYCKFYFQNSRRSGWFSCEKRLVIDSRCGNVYDLKVQKK